MEHCSAAAVHTGAEPRRQEHREWWRIPGAQGRWGAERERGVGGEPQGRPPRVRSSGAASRFKGQLLLLLRGSLLPPTSTSTQALHRSTSHTGLTLHQVACLTLHQVAGPRHSSTLQNIPESSSQARMA